jgi:hypothetical protein
MPSLKNDPLAQNTSAAVSMVPPKTPGKFTSEKLPPNPTKWTIEGESFRAKEAGERITAKTGPDIFWGKSSTLCSQLIVGILKLQLCNSTETSTSH